MKFVIYMAINDIKIQARVWSKHYFVLLTFAVYSRKQTEPFQSHWGTRVGFPVWNPDKGD